MLLSDNDLREVQAALDGRLEIEMVRSLGPGRVRITTAQAPPVWAPYQTLARVETWRGQVYSTRWCVSGEEVLASAK